MISENRLMLQLPKTLKDQVQAEAKRKHLSLNGLIRLALFQSGLSSNNEKKKK